MKNKLILLSLIIIFSNSFAKPGEPYKGGPNFHKYTLSDLKMNEEIRAYRGLTRTLDEMNKQMGKESNFRKEIKGDNFGNLKFPISSNLIDSAIRRVYFGNQNEIETIEMMSEQDFKARETDEFEYKLFGIYKRVADKKDGFNKLDQLNPLQITTKKNAFDKEEDPMEYEKYILGKNKGEVLEFFKEKLEGVYPTETFIIEDDKLFVEDNENKKWEIDLSTVPITVPGIISNTDTESDRTYTDNIHNEIFKYSLFENNEGRVFYNLGKDIRIEYKEKPYENNVLELVGKGKVNKVISMPKGNNKNILNISSQQQGDSRYGYNIIFGSDLKLENVNEIGVHKDVVGGHGGGPNITNSGETTLSFELDPTKKNDKGHYYKHVLSNTENSEDIFIHQYGTSSWSSEEAINDFNIRLMVSAVSENGTVDMGRKLNTVTSGYYPTKLNLSFISDSFAHALTKRTDDPNSDENRLLDIKVRDEIKLLSDSENSIYKSILNGKKIGLFSPTISSTNKRVKYKSVDSKAALKRDLQFVEALRGKNIEKIFEMGDFSLTESEKKKVSKDIENLMNGTPNERLEDDLESKVTQQENHIKSLEEEFKKANDELKDLEKNKMSLKDFYNSPEYKSLNLNSLNMEIKNLNLDRMKNNIETLGNYDSVPSGNSSMQDIKNSVQNIEHQLQQLKLKNPNQKIIKEIDERLEEVKSNINIYENGPSWKKGTVGPLREAISETKKLEKTLQKIPNLEKIISEEIILKNKEISEKEVNYLSSKENKKTENELYAELLYQVGRDYSYYYPRIKDLLFQTLETKEALEEFKTMLRQLQETNIYSKINKVSKEELSTYTNIPFGINRKLSDKEHYARGGFVSARTVQDNFKGNVYTAYGLYEKKLDKEKSIGFMVGGANTNHTLTHNKRSALTTPAESTSKGVSAYIGTYYDKNIWEQIDWISGIGAQYGSYKVERQLRNNYQELKSKGTVKVLGLNTYTGLVINYPLQEDVVVQGKGILSYSFMHQGDVSETDGLNLDIEAQNYHYVDGEIGISLNKTLYDFGVKSNLSAGIASVFGVVGYKNDDLKAKVHGSSSSFPIKGDRIQKDAVKIHIDYNVQMDTGFNYGLEGTYITNKEESNVKFGIKAGYAF